uniref:Lipid storage droplets surface-binding protein 2 n=3 Tax=Culex pipiens TaxID=7175 RepID=A0A8D8FJL6_CULPI
MPTSASELTRCRGWSPEKAGEPIDKARTRSSKINDLRSKLQRVKLEAQQIIADKQREFLKQREELERNHESAMFQLQLEEKRCKEFYRVRRDELINESNNEWSGKSRLSTHNYESGWQEQQRKGQMEFDRIGIVEQADQASLSKTTAEAGANQDGSRLPVGVRVNPVRASEGNDRNDAALISPLRETKCPLFETIRQGGAALPSLSCVGPVNTGSSTTARSPEVELSSNESASFPSAEHPTHPGSTLLKPSGDQRIAITKTVLSTEVTPVRNRSETAWHCFEMESSSSTTLDSNSYDPPDQTGLQHQTTCAEDEASFERAHSKEKALKTSEEEATSQAQPFPASFTYDTPKSCHLTCLQLASPTMGKERESMHERSVYCCNSNGSPRYQRCPHSVQRLPEIAAVINYHWMAHKASQALEDVEAVREAEADGERSSVVNVTWQQTQNVDNSMHLGTTETAEDAWHRAVNFFVPMMLKVDRPQLKPDQLLVKGNNTHTENASIIKEQSQDIYDRIKPRDLRAVTSFTQEAGYLRWTSQQRAASLKELSCAGEVPAIQCIGLAINGVDTKSHLAGRLLNFYFPTIGDDEEGSVQVLCGMSSDISRCIYQTELYQEKIPRRAHHFHIDPGERTPISIRVGVRRLVAVNLSGRNRKVELGLLAENYDELGSLADGEWNLRSLHIAWKRKKQPVKKPLGDVSTTRSEMPYRLYGSGNVTAVITGSLKPDCSAALLRRLSKAAP